MMPYILTFIEPELGAAVVGGGADADDELATDAMFVWFRLVYFVYFVLVFRRFTHSINIVYKLI